MSYAVEVVPFDIADVFGKTGPVMLGSIFVPPPPRASIATPTPLAAGTPAANDADKLVFPSGAVPPAATCAMLVHETRLSGDLFRSGPVLALPASPATLTLFTGAPKPLEYDDLRERISQVLMTTFQFPDAVRALGAALTGGVITPLSFTPDNFTLDLGPTSTIAINGHMNVKFLGLIDQASGFSLTAQLTLAPSGDVSDPTRILSVTSASPILSVDAFFLAPPAALAMAMFAGGAIASTVEDNLNVQIAGMVSDTVAAMGKMLTSTAVISIVRLSISSTEMSAVAVIADLFGGAIVPIPENLLAQVTPPWKCGVKQTYTVTVRNAIDSSPVPGAAVNVQTGAGGALAAGGPTVQASTGPDGTAQLANVTLKSWTSVHPRKGQPPVVLTFQPVLTVSAAGFNTFISQITCPTSPLAETETETETGDEEPGLVPG